MRITLRSSRSSFLPLVHSVCCNSRDCLPRGISGITLRLGRAPRWGVINRCRITTKDATKSFGSTMGRRQGWLEWTVLLVARCSHRCFRVRAANDGLLGPMGGVCNHHRRTGDVWWGPMVRLCQLAANRFARCFPWLAVRATDGLWGLPGRFCSKRRRQLAGCFRSLVLRVAEWLWGLTVRLCTRMAKEWLRDLPVRVRNRPPTGFRDLSSPKMA
jgi:hypothetical protein